jgi:hypothetical protein
MTAVPPWRECRASATVFAGVARRFHELLSRDREDGCTTGYPQGVGPEAYLNGASQDELVLSLPKEHPRTLGRTAISVVAASDS